MDSGQELDECTGNPVNHEVEVVEATSNRW